MPIYCKTYRKTTVLLLIVLLLVGSLAGCVTKLDGETPEELKARKRAIYSAQVVAGLASLSDLTQILFDGNVINSATGSKLIDINERALSAADILRDRLKTGFDAAGLDNVRNILADIEKGRLAGVITFNSQKALNFYFDVTSGILVTLNLIEALEAGQKEPSARSAARRAMDSLETGSDEPKWWNRAIVEATETFRIFSEQAVMSTAVAWVDADARSGALNQLNQTRLNTWKNS